MCYRSFAFVTGCLVLGACAQSAPQPPITSNLPAPLIGTPTPSPVPTPAKSASAGSCRVTRQFNDAGWIIRMRMAKDSGPCTVNTEFTANGRTGSVPVHGTSGQITTAPLHGTVQQAFNPSDSSASYTPNAGYTGPDHFDMRVLPSSRNWSVDVTVGP